jgi:protein TonB
MIETIEREEKKRASSAAVRTEAPRTAQPQIPDEDEEEPGFLRRHWIGILVGLLVAGTVVWLLFNTKGGDSAPPARKVEAPIVRVQLPPPPPPPPPPKVQPPEQKLEEQPQMAEPELKPEEAKDEPPKAKDEPPAGLGTNIKGDGTGDGFGLSGSGNGLFGRGSGQGNASKWGWYAGQVQSTVAEAMRRNPRTKSANLRVQIRIWPNTTGRITRAQLVGSTGDPALDNAITNDVLNGLQLQQPPPKEMPMPIVLRLTARRPGGH